MAGSPLAGAIAAGTTWPGPPFPWAGDKNLGYVPVGYQNAPGYPGALTDGSNITVQSNTTYKYFQNLGANSANQGLGTPSVPVSGVTCIGCEWEQSGANAAALPLFGNGSGITLQYCTIAPVGAYAGTVTPAIFTQAQGYQYAIVADGTQAVPGTFNTFCAPLTIDHCEIWGFSNATKVAQGTSSAPHVFKYVWIHDPRPNTNGLDHTDGLGCPGGGGEQGLVIQFCNINGNGDTQAIAYQQSTSGSFVGVTCTDNLLGGYGTTVNFGGGGAADAATNVLFKRNVFTTAEFEPTFILFATNFATASGCVWTGNRWWVPSNAVWGNTAHNGWYWIPNATAVSGTDDSQFVQQAVF